MAYELPVAPTKDPRYEVTWDKESRDSSFRLNSIAMRSTSENLSIVMRADSMWSFTSASLQLIYWITICRIYCNFDSNKLDDVVDDDDDEDDLSGESLLLLLLLLPRPDKAAELEEKESSLRRSPRNDFKSSSFCLCFSIV